MGRLACRFFAGLATALVLANYVPTFCAGGLNCATLLSPLVPHTKPASQTITYTITFLGGYSALSFLPLSFFLTGVIATLVFKSIGIGALKTISDRLHSERALFDYNACINAPHHDPDEQ